MKKVISLSLCMIMTAALIGCGDSDSAATTNGLGQSKSVSDVLEEGMASADASESVSDSADASVAGTSDSSGVSSLDSSVSVSGASDVSNAASTGSSDQVRQSGVSADAPEPEAIDESQVLSSTEGVDVDLTTLSSTMVYSEVYNMMIMPEDYMGKTIKMNGMFSYMVDETTGNEYYACIIMDATACCSQGIEFELAGDYVYPDDYPEIGGDITITGTFDVYEEDGYKYCTLRNATMG